MNASQDRRYEDFEILIGPDDGRGHRLHVQSPAGAGHDILKLPFSAAELARLTASEDAWQPPRPGRDKNTSPKPVAKPRELGKKLFAAAFPNSIRDLFHESFGQVSKEGLGLRICLRTEAQHPELLRLLSLPWELLRPPRRGFFVLNRKFAVVRRPDVPRAVGRKPEVQQLRVLVVSVVPTDQRALELDPEWETLEALWQDHPTVRLAHLSNPTVDDLRQRLEDGRFHVLHFMGHGGFHRRQNEWAVAFVKSDDTTDFVGATRLAEELADFNATLRLVVLNACRTARVHRETPAGTPPPGAGVAMALMSAGIHAVVATQAIISDRAAIELTHGLYHRLAAGDPLERALAVARKRIRNHEWTGAVWPAEWATPVLFQRAGGEDLFDVPARETPPEEPESWRMNPIGLAALGCGGLGAALLPGLASLWVWDSAPLQYVTAVVAGTLGGLTWLVRWIWGRYDADRLANNFSHAVATSRTWRVLLFALLFLSTSAWAWLGTAKLESLRCRPLGARSRGVDRIAVIPWEKPRHATRQEALWAQEITDELVDKLRLIDTIEILVWRQGDPAYFDSRCIDATISGRVRQDGVVHLRGTLGAPHRPRAFFEESAAPADDGGIDHIRNDLVRQAVLALAVEMSPALEEQLESPPTSDREARKLNRLGVLAFLNDEHYEAESKFRGALALDPLYASAHNNLGLVLAAKEPPDYSRAVNAIERAAALAPNHARYHFNLGQTLEKSGALDEAAAAYRRAIEHNKIDVRAYNNLGFTYLLSGRVQEARNVLEQGRNLSADEGLKPFFEKNLGRVALAEGDAGKAVEHLERAVRLRPRFPEAHDYLARARASLNEQGANKQGAADLVRSAEAPEPRFVLAVLTHADGEVRIRPAGHVPGDPYVADTARRTVGPGDRVEVAAGAEATFLCANSRVLRLDDSTGVEAQLCGDATGHEVDLVALNFASLELVAPARGEDRESFEHRPVIVSPRCPVDVAEQRHCAALLDPAPSLQWLALAGAEQYHLELTGPRRYERVIVGAEEIRCTALEALDGRRLCALDWPVERWKMTEGHVHRLEVIAVHDSQIVRSGKTLLKPLLATEAARVRAAADEIERVLGAATPPGVLTRAAAYSAFGLANEAVKLLESAPKSWSDEADDALLEAFYRIDLPELLPLHLKSSGVDPS